MLSNFYGTQIKASRKRLKMTVDDFAERLGVSRATQMNYESGKTLPNLAYLDSCANLGIDPMSLLLAGTSRSADNNLDSSGLAVELFKLLDSPREPLDTPSGRAWLFEEALRLVGRALPSKD